uniref:Ig-like domain-containing protein n=1 Tax=Oryzias melastigma TaxID=30732 RepID=A0A3B3C8F8_ORYME
MEPTNVLVKNSSSYIQTSVDQSSSENIHAGDSVTLNCTVHTGSCDGEHRVYWFKDSEDSHPGLIYTHGGRNDQCEHKKTQPHSCVYELLLKNLTRSHAGIYYCAVASCGHILFGKGTKLDLRGEFNLEDSKNCARNRACRAPAQRDTAGPECGAAASCWSAQDGRPAPTASGRPAPPAAPGGRRPRCPLQDQE